MKTIADHVLDIIQNSVRSGATRIEFVVEEEKNKNLFTLKIEDNGCGMSSEDLEQAANPFFTSRKTRKVGLGLPLLNQKATGAGGSFRIDSEPEKGTVVQAVFKLNHLDRPPLGNIWETWYLTLAGNPGIRLIYRHIADGKLFVIDSEEVLEMLDGVSLRHKEVRKGTEELIKNNLLEIEAKK